MKKQLLREQGKLILKSFSNNKKRLIEEKLHQQLFNSAAFKQSGSIATTVSLPGEWSTYPIIKHAWEEKKKVFVPKCDPRSKKMTFYHLTDFNQLETVFYGLKEPSPSKTTPVLKNDIDFILVPGLLFDRQGYRIGYGGGFYDRYLVDYQGRTASMLSKEQLIKSIPVETFDEPVQQLMIENEIINTFSN
ncbi:5-formyltetrahydrofolate cyclo-ligase [Halobacillus sp. Marseille-P3879]|uniref:5-formyltetrahydrofolate cyclo-ligase n=1 Tax=Halobacillus sp. Marseille-P3879 TaxID=2045014 RepID=UPI000C79DA0F|nr:5-formyltetrahydrofolate cyclo-ligase [Halobacillus sp. Marseille-P3879]